MKAQALQSLRCRCGIDIGYKFLDEGEEIEEKVINTEEFICKKCAAKFLQILKLCKLTALGTVEQFYHGDRTARIKADEEMEILNNNLFLIKHNGIAED